MRLSTASLILAFAASLAVQAAPTPQTSALDFRSVSIGDVTEARDISSTSSEVEVRDPKKKKGKKGGKKGGKKAAAKRDEDELEERDELDTEIEEREAEVEVEARDPKKKKGKKGGKKGGKKAAAKRDELEDELEEREAEPEVEARDPKKKKGKKGGKKAAAGAAAGGAAAGAAGGAAAGAATAKAGASKAAITITGTGAASIPAKPDGCATITPAGSTAQTVCAKAITATGFSMSVKDVATGKKISCTVTGTSGTCGTTGAGASVSALA